MTDILALDLATFTGFARGHVGGSPAFGSLRFGKPGASQNAIFWHCLRWISAELEPEPRPDIIVLEALLPPEAKVGRTTRETRDRLSGLNAIVRAIAFRHRVFEIQEAGVNDVRGHFLGTRKLQRDEAKNKTLARCRALGWQAENTDEADALALWHYACSQIDPELALQVSPMFNKQLRAAE